MFNSISMALIALSQIALIIAHVRFQKTVIRLLANVLKTEDMIHQVVEDHDQRIKKLELLI